MTCGSEEPNGIVQIGGNGSFTEPNVRATEQELYEGLEATAVKIAGQVLSLMLVV